MKLKTQEKELESKCKQNYGATRDEFIKVQEEKVNSQKINKKKNKDKGTDSKH